jgi:hypothetical protein
MGIEIIYRYPAVKAPTRPETVSQPFSVIAGDPALSGERGNLFIF